MDDLVAVQDPRRILKRGFALVSSGGRTVTGVGGLHSGEAIEIQLYDGRIEAEIQRTIAKKTTEPYGKE